LVAAVVLDGLSGPRRAFLHRRAAAALDAAHSSNLGPVAARLAAHYLAAGEEDQAAAHFELAARHALSLAAPAEAVALYRQALNLAPTPARYLGLGEAQYWLGDPTAARAAYEQALALAEAQGERRAAARACLGLAETFLPVGRPDDVVRWAERSIDYLDVDADPTAHARAHFLFGAGRLRAGGPALAEAERHLAEAARLAEENHLAAIASISRFELGNLRAERGDLAAAIAAYEESVMLAEAAGEPNQQVLSHNNAAFHAMLAGDLPAAHRHIAMALDLADRLDLRLARQYLYSTRGEIALAEGQWDVAEEWFERSQAEAEAHGNVEQLAKARANLGLAAVGRGDLDSALILLEEAAALAAPLTARYMHAQIDLWLAETYLTRGERVAAQDILSRAEGRLAGGYYARLSAQAAQLRDRSTS
jgi:tetratricopeptide (TPR) repeat protein